MVDECGENITTEQLKDYVWKTLNSGKVLSFICLVHWLYLVSQLFLLLKFQIMKVHNHLENLFYGNTHASILVHCFSSLSDVF